MCSMYMGRLSIPSINELFVDYFGEEHFTKDLEEGKSSFDYYLLEAIITASEEKIIKSIDEAEIVIKHVKNDFDKIIDSFNSRQYKISQNQDYLKDIIISSLND